MKPRKFKSKSHLRLQGAGEQHAIWGDGPVGGVAARAAPGQHRAEELTATPGQPVAIGAAGSET